MDAATIDAIKQALIPVAAKIGEGAAFGWDVVVRQQIVFAWLGLFFAIKALIVLWWTIKCVWPWAVAHRDSSDGLSYVPPTILVLASSVVFSVAGSIAITHILNPQYYAITFFVQLAQTAVK